MARNSVDKGWKKDALTAEAKARGLRGYSTLNKDGLIQLLNGPQRALACESIDTKETSTGE